MPSAPCRHRLVVVKSICDWFPGMQHEKTRLSDFRVPNFKTAPTCFLGSVCLVTPKQAAGLWERALEVAEANDRINLSTTHQLYAQHLEKVKVGPTHARYLLIVTLIRSTVVVCPC